MSSTRDHSCILFVITHHDNKYHHPLFYMSYHKLVVGKHSSCALESASAIGYCELVEITTIVSMSVSSANT